MPTNKEKKWYQSMPHPVILLLVFIGIAGILTQILPAGVFDREEVAGRMRVVPGTFHNIDRPQMSFMSFMTSFSRGFKTASDIIFVVLSSGIMFGILQKTEMIENAVGSFVNRFGQGSKAGIIIMLTYLFGLLGIVVGYENNIAMIPIAAVLIIALGGDLLLTAGVSVGAITMGFGLSPFNPYTVGMGHTIAEMPMFSGWELRAVLCFLALTLLGIYNMRYYKKMPEKTPRQQLAEQEFKLNQDLSEYRFGKQDLLVAIVFVGGLGVMLYGIFNHHWFFPEISAIFILISLAAAIVSRMPSREFSTKFLESVATVAPGAFMVGLATTIKVVLEQGQISDTISFYLSEFLSDLPTYMAAVSMSISQCIINFMIPSGSGQALATLPIMIPAGELSGLTRQTSILAFQIGDGVTNLINPTLGGLIAMLSLCKVDYDQWLSYIWKVTLWILVLSWIFLIFSVSIMWGPF